jgi:hypothetical protein
MSKIDDALHDLRLLLTRPDKDIVRAARALGVPKRAIREAVEEDDHHGLAYLVIVQGYGERTARQARLKLRSRRKL